ARSKTPRRCRRDRAAAARAGTPTHRGGSSTRSAETARGPATPCCGPACCKCSVGAGELDDEVVVEIHEAIELRLEDALLVAVRAVTERPVLLVRRGADAEAAHALCTQERHVGGARAHHRHHGGAVVLADRALDGDERRVIDWGYQ